MKIKSKNIKLNHIKVQTFLIILKNKIFSYKFELLKVIEI